MYPWVLFVFSFFSLILPQKFLGSTPQDELKGALVKLFWNLQLVGWLIKDLEVLNWDRQKYE
jgi:hypothetical protein